MIEIQPAEAWAAFDKASAAILPRLPVPSWAAAEELIAGSGAAGLRQPRRRA
jgi:hypothetical protein